MSFRSIILDLHEPEVVEAVVNAAVAVGEAKRTHLIGVHSSPMSMHTTSIPYYLPDDILEKIKTSDISRARNVEKQFEEIRHTIDFPTTWHLHHGVAGTGRKDLLSHVLSSDLIVVSQSIRVSMPLLLRELLQRSSTPILVTPTESLKPIRFNRITVVWNDSTQTIRAIRDAMQILEKADSVRILPTSPESKPKEGSVGGSDIVTWLKYHDVPVTLDNHPDHHLKSGSDIVKDAKDDDADLLVMGGYGHSPLYDAVVGGLTDDILEHSDIPVFLSH